MRINFTKYFSLFLILFLINSNYSFAITQMLCKMSKIQTECECSHWSGKKETRINSDDAACCDITIHEINNSNTLDKTKFSPVNDNPVSTINYILPVIFNSKSFSLHKIFRDLNKPFRDIPLLNCTLLI